MPVSDKFRALYTDSYAGGAKRAWRDVGAVDKGENVIRAWGATAFTPLAKPQVVDIGCGEGALADYLATRGFFDSYLGLDLAPSAIDEAQARSVNGARFVRFDGDRVPLGDNSADVAILSHVVEHLEHPRALIYEAARIAPYVIVEVPLEGHRRLPRDHVWTELGHINHYTSTTIRRLLQTCGLEIMSQFTTNPSKACALFHGSGAKRRISWEIKQRGLLVAPKVARDLFTYHETLLTMRQGAVDK